MEVRQTPTLSKKVKTPQRIGHLQHDQCFMIAHDPNTDDPNRLNPQLLGNRYPAFPINDFIESTRQDTNNGRLDNPNLLNTLFEANVFEAVVLTRIMRIKFNPPWINLNQILL